jgi:hypothetical protein
MERNNCKKNYSKKTYKPRIKKDSKAEMELTDSIIMEISPNDILNKDIEPMDICNDTLESLETEKFLSMEVCIDLLKDLEPLESLEPTHIIKNITEPMNIEQKEPIENLELLNFSTPEILNPIESELIKYRCLYSLTPEIVEPIVPIQNVESTESKTPINSVTSEIVEPIVPIQNVESTESKTPINPIEYYSDNNMLYVLGSIALTLIVAFSYFRRK